MDAGTLSILKIFGQDRRHVVPLFQRPYVWKREEQWQPLWDDVRAVAERLLGGADARCHFLGAIVLDLVPQPTGNIETRLLIDGQQRLTTIQLLLEAFCDLCATRGIEKYHKALLKLTRNDDPMSEDADDRFKVWPTNLDQEPYRAVMLAGSPAEVRKHFDARAEEVGHPIADAYLFFYNQIAAWLDQEPAGLSARVDALYKALRECVRMVVIDLGRDDDAQVIFETLNARGTPLLPADLVKNFLFHRARIEKQKLETLYEAYWKPFDEESDYWREEIGKGAARRARIDIFLQHYLALQTRDDVAIGHLYVIFREFAAKSGTARSHLESLHRYAQVYRSFDQAAPGSREALYFYRLGVLETRTVYPFLLELFARYAHNREALRAVLVDLESFLVRRMICRLTAKRYNKLFVELLPLNDGDEPLPQRVRAALLASDAETARWPDDVEFRAAWGAERLYQVLVRARLRMVLEALELQLVGPKCEVKLDPTPEAQLTIEHVMPQQWKAHWPLPPGPPPEAEARRERLIHTIGNLTLLNKALNPAVSNGPWKTKREDMRNYSRLTLNLALLEHPEWNEQRIEERTQKLFEIACRVWPHPGGA